VPGLSGAAEAYVYSDFGAPAGGSYLAYQFAGYRYDSETGLYYVGARYYSPTLGRFLQTDPIGTAGGNNLYAYVNNDPINLLDPTGLSAEETQNDSGALASVGAAGGSTQQTNGTGDPASVVMTGGKVYGTPTQGVVGNCGNCYFEGTIYTYQVVSSNGQPVTSDGMLVSEMLQTLTGNASIVNGGSSVTGTYAVNGSFNDTVGYISPTSTGFSNAALIVNAQAFSVTMQSSGNSFTISTQMLQIISTNSSGTVTGQAFTIKK
jgi:RHS repeat-associated protein